MRILVCGGTGVLGQYLVPVLVQGGHEVVVLARREASVQLARRLGGVAVFGDILEPSSLEPAVTGCEVVVHAATALPRTFPGRPADFAANDRIRRDGTRNLLAAAARAGVRRFVLQSIIWVHGDQHGALIDEEATLQPGLLARSAVDAEAMTRETALHHGFAADILRAGAFYAPEAYHTREIVARLRSRTAPIIGNGANYQCFVHAADAAAAFAAAALADRPGDTYFVVDDEPVRLGEYLTWLANVVGAKEPLHLPEFLARLTLGSEMAAAYGASLRCSNGRIRRQLGWAPRWRSFREGYEQDVLPKLGSE